MSRKVSLKQIYSADLPELRRVAGVNLFPEMDIIVDKPNTRNFLLGQYRFYVTNQYFDKNMLDDNSVWLLNNENFKMNLASGKSLSEAFDLVFGGN